MAVDRTAGAEELHSTAAEGSYMQWLAAVAGYHKSAAAAGGRGQMTSSLAVCTGVWGHSHSVGVQTHWSSLKTGRVEAGLVYCHTSWVVYSGSCCHLERRNDCFPLLPLHDHHDFCTCCGLKEGDKEVMYTRGG